MDNACFNSLVKPLNIQYMEIFEHIPRITDYSCTREEYLKAMQNAVQSKNPLSEFLMERRNRFETRNVGREG